LRGGISKLYAGHPIPKEKTFIGTYKLLKKTVYGVGIDEQKNRAYGTEENLSISADKIYNVIGAYEELKEIVESQIVINENKTNYSNMADKLGDLHVYNDGRPMKYEHIK